MHTVDGVERRALEERVEVLPRRNEIDVRGTPVAAVDEPQVGVTRRRYEVVLAATAIGHERDHLARRAGVLGVHRAAGLLLERLDPVLFGVALPNDDVDLALALADG